MSGAVYSTNSKPSVPIGLANPVTVFSSTVVAILFSFARQLRFASQLFKRSETQQTQQSYACARDGRA